MEMALHVLRFLRHVSFPRYEVMVGQCKAVQLYDY